MGSPSMNVKGVRAPDQEYEEMKAVYDACVKAGVPVPERVNEFFCWEPPNPNRLMVDLDLSEAVEMWRDDYREGFEVEIAKLPKNITHVRFYLSW